MLRIILRVAWWLMPFIAALSISASIVYVATASATSAPVTLSSQARTTDDGRDDPMYVYAASNQRIPGEEFMIPGP